MKNLDQYGLEITIPSPNDRKLICHVMISRGKGRVVGEVHIPNAQLRSSAECSLNFRMQEEENLAWDSRRLASRRLVRPMFQVRLASRRLVRTPQQFSQPSLFFHTKNHSYDREEVESYSCQFFVWRSSVNSGLQNGYKNGASSRPR